MSRMTAAETRAIWSRVSQEQIDEMTRIAARFFSGQDLEPKNPPADPEPELPLSTAPEPEDRP